MSDLESILRQFNGKNFVVFRKNGSFTKKGYKVYADFCSFLYDLKTIVPFLDAERIERELDFIFFNSY